MRENSLKTLWQQDAYAVNGWLSLPATFLAEVMAHQGWDSLTIDLQHGLIDYESTSEQTDFLPPTRARQTESRVAGLRAGLLERSHRNRLAKIDEENRLSPASLASRNPSRN